MKQILKGVFLLGIIHSFQFCANPSSPSGGPKDTIPPSLINSVPLDQQTNFQSSEIELEFDEFINADKLRQSLIITPLYSGNYKSIVKKNKLYLKFEESFSDSTTYTLNFTKGVTDITERTSAENLRIAFSTGSYIDSLSISGNSYQLLTGEALDKNYLAAIYRVTDTLDLAKTKPTYFSSLDSIYFTISNIKDDRYLLLIFQDNNNNLTIDLADEPNGFLADTISLDTSLVNIQIPIVSVNQDSLYLISNRTSSHYYEIRLSKPISDLQLYPQIPYSLVEEKKVIRLYKPTELNFSDSLRTVIYISDTVGNVIADTLFISFNASQRKKAEFKVNTSNNSALGKESIFIRANKPFQFLTDTFYLNIDTLYRFTLDINVDSVYQKSTKIDLPLTRETYSSLLDSLNNLYQIDSANLDSIAFLHWNNIKRLNRERYSVSIPSVTSADQDTASLKPISQTFYDPDEYGQVNVTLVTEEKSFIVQVLNTKGKVQAQEQNCTECNFSGIKPDDYTIRILLDNNQNGKWEPGNLKRWVSPEEIINFKEITSVRANWTVELTYSF